MWLAAAPAGFTWGYDSRSTTENYEQWLASEASKMMELEAMKVPETPSWASGVPSVGPNVLSWYDAGERLTSALGPQDVPSKTRSRPGNYKAQKVKVVKVDGRWVAEVQPSSISVAQACNFFANPSLAGVSTADKKAFLASQGTSAFVIAQSECVAPEDNVLGRPQPDLRPITLNKVAMGKWVNGRWVAKVEDRPELPKAESTESSMSVAQACTFLANPSLAGASTADKKAFLASKGVSAFVIAQSECVAPEDNVLG
jgi:hypothetical protein